jgi:uncharacterized membrane protein YfcA
MIATLLGVILGSLFSKKLSGDELKKYFGIMVLVVGFYIVVEQIINI